MPVLCCCVRNVFHDSFVSIKIYSPGNLKGLFQHTKAFFAISQLFVAYYGFFQSTKMTIASDTVVSNRPFSLN